jgi:hypothetical protein
MYSTLLTSRWIWVAAVAVFFSDLAISAVNIQFCVLVVADFPRLFNSPFLRIKVTGNTFASTLSDVPSPFRVWHYVM